MIEVATGAAFLMASLYGAGHANAQNENIAVSSTTIEKAHIARTMIDSRLVEAMVRNEFADVPILVEIARCESTFRQFDKDGEVIRGRVNGADVGVMQINEKYHGEDAKKMGIDIYEIDGNMKFARHLYNKFGTSPWSASKPCWGNVKVLAAK